jgi:hypothetical protein
MDLVIFQERREVCEPLATCGADDQVRRCRLEGFARSLDQPGDLRVRETRLPRLRGQGSGRAHGAHGLAKAADLCPTYVAGVEVAELGLFPRGVKGGVQEIGR